MLYTIYVVTLHMLYTIYVVTLHTLFTIYSMTLHKLVSFHVVHRPHRRENDRLLRIRYVFYNYLVGLIFANLETVILTLVLSVYWVRCVNVAARRTVNNDLATNVTCVL